MNRGRYACVVIPAFPVAVWTRRDPSPANIPTAVAETEKDSSALVACNAEALHAGINLTMTAAQAHSRCPDLTIKLRDTRGEKEISRLIVKQLQTRSPGVEEMSRQNDSLFSATGGVFFLDASGLRFIYANESELAEKVSALISDLGFPVQVGVADYKFTSHVAAMTSSPSGHVIVPSGTEKKFLTHLPIAHLPLSENTRETLRNLGLKTIGQLVPFPANEMTERFGAEGSLLSQLAAGADRLCFLPDTPVEPLTHTIPFIFSISNRETLSAYIERALAILLNRLQQSGQVCAAFLLTCRLEDKRLISLNISLDRPTVALAPFKRQLRITLERTAFPSPVTDITVTIPEPTPLVMEQTTFHQKSVGRSSRSQPLPPIRTPLYSLEVHPTHLPETAFRLIPITSPKRTRPQLSSELRPLWPQTFTGQKVTGLRLLHPPLQTKVVTAQGQTLLWTAPKQPHRIARKQGPWKLSGGWWSGEFDRLYYEMQTIDRQCYLVFFDRLASQWFVQGIFD